MQQSELKNARFRTQLKARPGRLSLAFDVSRASVRTGVIIFVLLTASSLLSYAGQKATVPARAGWELTWSDEFNSGSAPDPARWQFAVGGNGWGNKELEYYTARPENARIRHGNLEIVARKENYTGSDAVKRDYTSARLITSGKFEQAYGRFEARIKIPFGQGVWPAFWLLGADDKQVGWPTCGEIDIMENIGREPATVHGTIHGPGYSGGKGIGAPYSLPSGKFAHEFHVYAVEWEPEQIRFYVDDRLYATRKPSDLPPGTKWVYDHPFYILLNFAVGGEWPGSPDATTKFPQTMLVDYVRVYKKAP
jgi:beta-glucanase (GH16 family)